jgi:hypothetical protein
MTPNVLERYNLKIFAKSGFDFFDFFGVVGGKANFHACKVFISH